MPRIRAKTYGAAAVILCLLLAPSLVASSPSFYTAHPPRSYKELREYPATHQKYLFMALNREDRRKVYVEQLQFLIDSGKLNQKQVALLKEEQELAWRSDVFVKNSPTQKRLREICGEKSVAFVGELRKAYVPGYEVALPSVSHVRPWLAWLEDYSSRSSLLHAQTPCCNCNQNQDYECLLQDCGGDPGKGYHADCRWGHVPMLPQYFCVSAGYGSQCAGICGCFPDYDWCYDGMCQRVPNEPE